jgi:hypothetical protein
MRFRTPEIFLGAFLAVAVFAMGMLFASSGLPPMRNSPPQQSADQQDVTKTATEYSSTIESLWIPTDSVGLYTLVLAAFTALLVGVSGWQGYFLLRADNTTRIAANAATKSANAAFAAERARFFIEIESHNLSAVIANVESRGTIADGENFWITVNIVFKITEKRPASSKY